MNQEKTAYNAAPSVTLESDQSDGVALGILDERLPLVVTSRTERVVAMRVDHARVFDDIGEPVQTLQGLVHVADMQIEKGCRGTAIQQQPHAVEVEEQKARRVETCGRGRFEQHRVEVRSTVEILGVQRHLDESHHDLPSSR